MESIGNALGHHRIILPLGRLHGLFPPRRAQAPFAAGVEAGDAAEVVAAGGGEVEEFLGDDGCEGDYLVGGPLLQTAEKRGEPATA